MAQRLSERDALAFVAALPAHTGKLATVRPDGRPHVAPVWVAVDGRELVFTTNRDTVKGRSLRRDRRVAICFDDEQPPFSFVTVEGEVTISEDLDEMLRWATVIGGRYMGDDKADAYGRRNAVEGELLVRLAPTRVVGMSNIAD
jgi:PPOX class probable F420-dependent enzyme